MGPWCHSKWYQGTTKVPWYHAAIVPWSPGAMVCVRVSVSVCLCVFVGVCVCVCLSVCVSAFRGHILYSFTCCPFASEHLFDASQIGVTQEPGYQDALAWQMRSFRTFLLTYVCVTWPYSFTCCPFASVFFSSTLLNSEFHKHGLLQLTKQHLAALRRPRRQLEKQPLMAAQ